MNSKKSNEKLPRTSDSAETKHAKYIRDKTYPRWKGDYLFESSETGIGTSRGATNLPPPNGNTNA